jgi:hypothetical protein
MNRSLKCGLVLLCIFVALSAGGVFGEKSTTASTMAQSNAMSAIKAGSNATAPDAADANSAIIYSVIYSKTSQSIEIKNNETSALDLTGWKLEVQNKTVYAFPKYSLGVNATVKVHSGLGKNSKTDLYAVATLLTKPDDEVSLLDATGTVISTSEESKEVLDSANDA